MTAPGPEAYNIESPVKVFSVILGGRLCCFPVLLLSALKVFKFPLANATFSYGSAKPTPLLLIRGK